MEIVGRDLGYLLFTVSSWSVALWLAKVLATGALRNPQFLNYIANKFKKKSISMKDQYISLVKEVCSKEGVDADLFCAIIAHESSWNPDALKYDPEYQSLKLPVAYAKKLAITLETEAQLQKISWGLCQIMGATARWCGYEKCLTHLLEPRDNIEVGVSFFKNSANKYPEIKDKIAAWNTENFRKDATGLYSNQTYVDMVYAIYSDLKKVGT